jgi:hypothetical protein
MKTVHLSDQEWSAIGILVGVVAVPNWWYERTMLRDGSGARKIRVSVDDIGRASRYFVDSVLRNGLVNGMLNESILVRCYEVFARTGCVNDMVRLTMVKHIK